MALNAHATRQVKPAQWITAANGNVNAVNTWIAFRKDIDMTEKPKKLMARIAADSKYWLWVNGKLTIFEGGLKRGPSPTGTYYDEVDLAPALSKGQNRIAVLLCYFGKSGFSHLSSGKSGLYIDADNDEFDTNNTWKSTIHPAYGITAPPDPNYRLPESNIRYDAAKELKDWQDTPDGSAFRPSAEIGEWNGEPWGEMVKRPIPMFKDYGVKDVAFKIKKGNGCDTVVALVPGDLQMTPVINVTDNKGGQTIGIMTNHSFAAGQVNIRAEYVTRKGEQTYESLGWMNGEEIILTVPHGINVNRVAYRETGYDTTAEGTFTCDNEFINRFWEKALNTLYVNMRDTYFDCPERERAQWWGDATVLMGECFYTYSTSVHQLMRKGILELCNWQRPDGIIYAPIPGNYEGELPAQMLASIGQYGFWTYYMNTADKALIEQVYPHVKKYLDVWKHDPNGLTAERHGGWDWGDWGDNRDIRLMYAAWHNIALKAAANMADLLGKQEEAKDFRQKAERVKEGFNTCWNGKAYRFPDYKDDTDDRVQALAVLADIADESKYEAIYRTLQEKKHASPYMEKYIFEALFKMGKGEYAMKRMEERFNYMVNNDFYPTLFEGWDVGPRGFGGGTTNHAWSGGPLTVIAQYLMGVNPIQPAYHTFSIDPQYVVLNKASLTFPTVSGTIGTSFEKKNGLLTMTVDAPEKTQALVYIPSTKTNAISIDGKPIKQKAIVTDPAIARHGKTACWLKAGHHVINIQQ